IGEAVEILTVLPLRVKKTPEVQKSRLRQDNLERQEPKPTMMCCSEHSGIVADDARKPIALFQTVHHLPDRSVATIGIQHVGACAAIRRNARVTGEEQTIESDGARSAPVFFVVKRFQKSGPECTRSVAEKGNNLDRPAGR